MPGRSAWRAEAGQSDPNEKAPRPAGGIRGGATAQYSAERKQRAGSDERDIALRLAQSTNMGKFEAGRARAAELMLGRRVEAESDAAKARKCGPSCSTLRPSASTCGLPSVLVRQSNGRLRGCPLAA